MFNVLKLKEIEFRSNPSLGEDFKVECSTNDFGSPVNKVVLAPVSNRPFYEGARYDPVTMSLRAKLNCGVALEKVSFGQLENDPNVLMQSALHFEQSLQQRYDEIQSKREEMQPTVATEPKIEPKTE